MAKAKIKKINHAEMLEKIRAYKSLNSSKEAIEKELEQCKNYIIDVMTTHNLEEYEVDAFKVTYRGSERTSVDSDRLKTERPDVYKKYSKTSIVKRLNVT